jgi:hypothetical protein
VCEAQLTCWGGLDSRGRELEKPHMDTFEPSMNVDKLNAFLGRALTDLAAGYGGVMVSLGHRLGLFKAMAGAGPLSSRELAERAGCAERYVREWLGSNVAGGYISFHSLSDTYELPPEHAFVLANEDSPAFLPSAWSVPASMWFDEDKAVEAFRTGKGVPWGDHHARLHCGVAAFYRNAYRASLVQEWLPALDGVVEKLKLGGLVADVGCGHGHSTTLLARAFPTWGVAMGTRLRCSRARSRSPIALATTRMPRRSPRQRDFRARKGSAMPRSQPHAPINTRRRATT